MKRLFGVVALVVASSASLPVHAFDNEPNGFRNVSWGASASTAQGLVRSLYSEEFLYSLSKSAGVDVRDFPLASYSRSDEKLEFGGVKITNIVYQFYSDRFFSATLVYNDSAFSIRGMRYAEMHKIGEPPPENYDAKEKVDRALKKYFGEPTDGPSFLARVALKTNKVTYKGDKTEIESNCDDSGERCMITFRSIAMNADYENELRKVVASRVTQAKASAQQKEAQMKAKSDF